MQTLSLVRLAGATAVVVLGLGACGDRVDDVIPANDPPAVTTTIAPSEQIPNECGMRIPRPNAPVYC